MSRQESRRAAQRLARERDGAFLQTVDRDRRRRRVRAHATELLVASLGRATRAFASAEDFLRAPEIGQMSCRILDLHPPRMSGTELHSLLLQRGLRIATLSTTARPGDEVKARVAAHRPIRFLIKPFTPAALVRCIQAALVSR